MVVIGDCEKGRELELDLELEIQPGMFLDKKGEERRIRIIRYDVRIEWDAALSAESRIQNIGGGDKTLAGGGGVGSEGGSDYPDDMDGVWY